MTRQSLTDASVWLFMSEGCSAVEIATYGGISLHAARAWMTHAAHVFAAPKRAGRAS